MELPVFWGGGWEGGLEIDSNIANLPTLEKEAWPEERAGGSESIYLAFYTQ